MISYLLNRWLFMRKFEKDGSGFIYRRRPHSPGIPVSDEERRQCIRLYRKRYWLQVGFLLALLIGGALAISTATSILWPGLDSTFVTYATYALCLVAVGIFVLKHLRLDAIPEEMFGDRHTIEPVHPAGTWKERYEATARRRSWWVHALLIIAYGVVTGLLIPRPWESEPGHWGLFLVFAACLGLGIYGVWVKVRTRKAPA